VKPGNQETTKNSSFMIVGAETSLECEDSDSDPEAEPVYSFSFAPQESNGQTFCQQAL